MLMIFALITFVLIVLLTSNLMYCKGYEAGKKDTKTLVTREKERARVNTLMKLRGF